MFKLFKISLLTSCHPPQLSDNFLHQEVELFWEIVSISKLSLFNFTGRYIGGVFDQTQNIIIELCHATSSKRLGA